MTPEQRQRKRAYGAAYRAANKERKRAYDVVYRATHKERIAASSAAYRAANKERIAARKAQKVKIGRKTFSNRAAAVAAFLAVGILI